MLAPGELIRAGAAVAPDGTVEGYASLFGEIDQARDMVMPGAFERSLRLSSVRRIPMLFQHDPAEPVGVWLELREDHRGLYARHLGDQPAASCWRCCAPAPQMDCRSAFAP